MMCVLFALVPGHFCYAQTVTGGSTEEAYSPSVSAPASADETSAPEAASPESWSLHGQLTNVTQYHPSFPSAFRGQNSLNSRDRTAETLDLTLFAGIRLWQGAEVYVNPELDQGFGLSNTLGVAGFPSAEGYKVGAYTPYGRIQRLFLRQVIDLGSAEQTVEPAANQLGGSHTADNVILSVGKFSVVDVFDTNSYAHDPRADFLNWAIVEAGAFDYAADAWGYTYGASAEWTQDWWAVRGGLFDLSVIPNGRRLEEDFSQYAVIGELEERHELLGHPGKLKLLGFVDRGRMANYSDAVRLGQQMGTTPDVALVRHYSSKPGIALNLEQEITPDVGAFARASMNDGDKEAFEFTEINRSISGGLSVKGNAWNRPDDTFGVAGAINALSDAARSYFAAGGLGILIGDGQLPHYGLEKIAEAYYSWQIAKPFALSADYQYVTNPAYNRDRGPVSVFGLRVHAEF